MKRERVYGSTSHAVENWRYGRDKALCAKFIKKRAGQRSRRCFDHMKTLYDIGPLCIGGLRREGLIVGSLRSSEEIVSYLNPAGSKCSRAFRPRSGSLVRSRPFHASALVGEHGQLLSRYS